MNTTNQANYFILYKGDKYLTFKFLLNIYTPPEKETASCRSTLWRYLHGNKNIKSIRINNRIAYSLDSICSDVELISRISKIELLAQLIKENQE